MSLGVVWIIGYLCFEPSIIISISVLFLMTAVGLIAESVPACVGALQLCARDKPPVYWTFYIINSAKNIMSATHLLIEKQAAL